MAHEHNSQCACPTDDKSILQNQTMSQVNLAQFWLSRGNLDLGSIFIGFAEQLIAKNDGQETEAQGWVLACKVLLADAQNDMPAALKYAREAEALSLKLFGEKHPALAIARGNLGEVLAKSGSPEEARTYLSKAIFVLTDKASEDETYTREYLDGAFVGFARILQELPARPKDRQPGE